MNPIDPHTRQQVINAIYDIQRRKPSKKSPEEVEEILFRKSEGNPNIYDQYVRKLQLHVSKNAPQQQQQMQQQQQQRALGGGVPGASMVSNTGQMQQQQVAGPSGAANYPLNALQNLAGSAGSRGVVIAGQAPPAGTQMVQQGQSQPQSRGVVIAGQAPPAGTQMVQQSQSQPQAIKVQMMGQQPQTVMQGNTVMSSFHPMDASQQMMAQNQARFGQQPMQRMAFTTTAQFQQSQPVITQNAYSGNNQGTMNNVTSDAYQQGNNTPQKVNVSFVGPDATQTIARVPSNPISVEHQAGTPVAIQQQRNLQIRSQQMLTPGGQQIAPGQQTVAQHQQLLQQQQHLMSQQQNMVRGPVPSSGVHIQQQRPQGQQQIKPQRPPITEEEKQQALERLEELRVQYTPMLQALIQESKVVKYTKMLEFLQDPAKMIQRINYETPRFQIYLEKASEEYQEIMKQKQANSAQLVRTDSEVKVGTAPGQIQRAIVKDTRGASPATSSPSTQLTYRAGPIVSPQEAKKRPAPPTPGGPKEPERHAEVGYSLKQLVMECKAAPDQLAKLQTARRQTYEELAPIRSQLGIQDIPGLFDDFIVQTSTSDKFDEPAPKRLCETDVTLVNDETNASSDPPSVTEVVKLEADSCTTSTEDQSNQWIYDNVKPCTSFTHDQMTSLPTCIREEVFRVSENIEILPNPSLPPMSVMETEDTCVDTGEWNTSWHLLLVYKHHNLPHQVPPMVIRIPEDYTIRPVCNWYIDETTFTCPNTTSFSSEAAPKASGYAVSSSRSLLDRTLVSVEADSSGDAKQFLKEVLSELKNRLGRLRIQQESHWTLTRVLNIWLTSILQGFSKSIGYRNLVCSWNSDEIKEIHATI